MMCKKLSHIGAFTYSPPYIARYSGQAFSVKLICKLDGKYSERVQLPAKAKFGGFCRQHLATLAGLEQQSNSRYGDCLHFTEFFDRYFHIPPPIVTKHELVLPFPHRNLPIKFWYKSVHNIFSYRGHRPTHTQTNAGKTYSHAFVGRTSPSWFCLQRHCAVTKSNDCIYKVDM